MSAGGQADSDSGNCGAAACRPMSYDVSLQHRLPDGSELRLDGLSQHPWGYWLVEHGYPGARHFPEAIRFGLAGHEQACGARADAVWMPFERREHVEAVVASLQQQVADHHVG